MTKEAQIKLLHPHISTANTLSYGDEAGRDLLMQRIAMHIRLVFGENSRYLKDLASIHFISMAIGVPEYVEQEAWQRGCERTAILIGVMIEDLTLQNAEDVTNKKGRPSMRKAKAKKPKVFVVHGHDEGMKEACARAIERLDLEAIILHEQVEGGTKSVLEKLEEHSDVEFAVILLSPDDVGRETGQSVECDQPRARQNVVLEFGYFWGLLGRKRVICFFRDGIVIEQPSDYLGNIYRPFDKHGAWKTVLKDELTAAKLI